MKKLEKLMRKNNGKIYIAFKTQEECREFYAIAQKHGFTFGTEPTTEKHTTDIVAVNSDKTLSYVGIVGRIACGCSTGKKVRMIYYADLSL